MLEVRQAVVRFGTKAAVEGFDLRVADGQVVAVLGPSGCGKSTLLRAIAGLEPLATGDVLWDGRSVVGVPPHRRGFGLMFQDYSLFPHKTVAGNVGFGLRMAGLSGVDLRDRVGAALDLVGMAGYEERTIGNLSGGEQQRVALARALAPEPRLLMLDEPVGALDRTLRERLVVELGELFAGLGITAIYVTHDQEEAFSVADKVVVMREGRVAQEGTPEEVYRRPADEWAARFLGFANVVEAEVREGRAVSTWGSAVVDWGPLPGTRSLDAPTTASSEAALPREGALAVRVVLPPDAVAVDPVGPIGGVVQSRTFRGGHYLLLVQVEDGPLLEVEVARSPVPAAGRPVRLRVIEERAVPLDA